MTWQELKDSLRSGNKVENILTFAFQIFKKRGLLGKAEGCINQLKVLGEEPKSRVWAVMAQSYCAGKEMEKAVKALEKAIKSVSRKWVPDPTLLSSCHDYLRERGEEKAVEDMLAFRKSRLSSAVSMVKDP
ncbi:hypothetical protein MLD38_029303 [Melastoma candidum]|uniref:Uncharacterized protein n=1 Tax=Melastoma candidum TaxID=119954 RepID=A0ACB9N4G8_9MYRT|nr:hypothetical protein MLD38_029303 [Melastoma candidum]